MRIYKLHKAAPPLPTDDSISARKAATVIALGDEIIRLQAAIVAMGAEIDWIGDKLT